MDILYRLSTNSYAKPKFPHATKEHCLKNALYMFPYCKFHLFVDETNLTDDGRKFAERIRSSHDFENFVWHNGGSSAGSWQIVMRYSLQQKGLDTVYYLEDDYLHCNDSEFVMQEGLAIADYCSLYDHRDKYIPGIKGGNPYIGLDGGEETKVFRTESCHWRLTNSTTMTFATTVEQMRKDRDIWDRHTSGKHPNDFQAFLDLRDRGRSLITPIPGYSTHCEPAWASPGIDWTRY